MSLGSSSPDLSGASTHSAMVTSHIQRYQIGSGGTSVIDEEICIVCIRIDAQHD
jgi:hypothetical protein